MSRKGPIKLALIISIIMGIALGFLYLLERQKIYSAIKENSRNLVSQEVAFHRQLGQEWDQKLRQVLSHNTLRLYLNAFLKQPGEVPEVYQDAVARLFLDITAYRSNMISRISLVDLQGQELLATEGQQIVSEPKDWYPNDYFRDAVNQPANRPVANQFEVKGERAFLYKMVPVAVQNKKIALLVFSIRIQDLINRYKYLLAATFNDQIIAVTKRGRLLLASDMNSVDKSELNNVITSIKQTSSSDPVVEFKQDVWSYIEVGDQGYYILFKASGSKITRYLNDEYLKVGALFLISSLVMILLVFLSTRRFQRQQAEQKSEQVIHSERSLSFASVSDEIRQPLNALLGALGVLEENMDNAQEKSYLESAKKNAMHIDELVKEFQDFARINAGEFQLEPIEFDIRATLHDIADLMSSQAKEKNLDIACLISSDTPRRVKGDVTRIRQVLINLISFAIKHTEHGEISLNLSAENLSPTEKLIHVDVSDTGNLVDQESMLAHFAMFTSDAYLQDKHSSGEGLGLALSKQLLGIMGGEICARENPLGGNTFRVTLPLQTVEPVSVSVPKDQLEGKRVLIVGEIENNRQMLSHTLSKWGLSGGTMDDFPHVVTVLHEAEENDKPYHACLIDVSLSSSSEKAFELVRQIRKEWDAQQLALIILTMQGAPGDAKMAKELGVQAFLTKPMTRQRLKEVLLRIFDTELGEPVEFITRHTLKEVEQEHRARILLADADPVRQKQIVRLLESPRFQVDLAVDGPSLETAINHNVYDMVLLDVDLPKLDVFNYVNKFRAYEKNLNTALNVSSAAPIRLPIIAIVPEVTVELTSRCEKYGLDNLISKPVTEDQLKDMLAYYLKDQ